MKDKKSCRVLVAGRNYCSNLCMARSFGEAGYEVEVLRVFEKKPQRKNLLAFLKPDAYSKYVKDYQVCISQKDNEKIVEKIIQMATPGQKKLLIPIDDLLAAVVDEHYDILSSYYIMPNINGKAGEISRLMSKEIQKEIAGKCGLPVVQSCLIKTENGRFEIPKSVNYPCFIKPNVSKNSTKNKMKKCTDEKDLRETVKEFSQQEDIEMLVEDYIEIKKEYSLLGLSTKGGIVGPGFFEAEEGGQADSRGVALIGKILSCEPWQEFIQELLRFIETLNYEGLFDIDLIESSDGRLYFVELNLRYGASGYVVTSNGVNLPGMFADYMFHQVPIDLQCQINKPNLRFINEKMLLESYAKRVFGISEVRERIRKTDTGFIRNANDKRPYRHFQRFYILAVLARIYFKMISRT